MGAPGNGEGTSKKRAHEEPGQQHMARAWPQGSGTGMGLQAQEQGHLDPGSA